MSSRIAFEEVERAGDPLLAVCPSTHPPGHDRRRCLTTRRRIDPWEIFAHSS